MVNKVSVEIDGKTFETFKSVNIDTDLDTFGFAFDLEINIPNQESDINTQGKAIKINIDGETLVTGFIEKQTISTTRDSTSIIINGRDKPCDFIDSRVSNKVFSTPIGFETLLKKLLVITGYEVVAPNKKIGLQTELGVNQIAVVNEYGDIENFANSEGIGFSKDESAYELIQRLADKRRLVLGTNGDGNIVIRKIGQKITSTILQRYKIQGVNTTANNIQTSTIVRDDSKRYYEYKIVSSSTSTNPNNEDWQSAVDNLKDNKVQYSGVFYDNEIRPTRKFIDYVANLTNSQCQERAEWECNIRRAKAFEYRCRIFGFRQNLNTVISKNPLWEINSLVYIFDEVCNVEGEFLVKSIKYSKSLSGTFCDLVLVNPLAYTDSVFEIKAKAGKKKKKSPMFWLGESWLE